MPKFVEGKKMVLKEEQKGKTSVISKAKPKDIKDMSTKQKIKLGPKVRESSISDSSIKRNK